MIHTEELRNLLSKEIDMPIKIRTEINERAEAFFDGLDEVVGKFLLEDLNDEIHSEDEVRAVVECVPYSLSEHYYQDIDDIDVEYCSYPIFVAASRVDAVAFVPLFAEVGLKHENIYGGGTIDCLLDEDDAGRNLLDLLASLYYSNYEAEVFDSICVDVMRRLRDMDLLKKEDIRRHRLLDYGRHCAKRFEFFVEWDPEILKMSSKSKDMPLIYDEVHDDRSSIEVFERLLKAGIRYFPQELGFLFFKSDDEDSVTVYDYAKKRFGAEASWTIIKDCLGHLIELDSESNMYPFMNAANEGSDSENLDLIYHLIQKDPRVVQDGLMQEEDEEVDSNENNAGVTNAEATCNRKWKHK